MVINKNLTLVGAGAEKTVIQTADSLGLAVQRVIRITEGSVLSISAVTVRYGSETSTEVRMIPFHSEADGMEENGIEGIRAEFGSGIYNQGTLTPIDSIVTENYAGAAPASSTAPRSSSRTAPSVGTGHRGSGRPFSTMVSSGGIPVDRRQRGRRRCWTEQLGRGVAGDDYHQWQPFQDQRRRVPQQQHRNHDAGLVNGK